MNGNGHEKKPKRQSRLDRIEAAIELMIGDHQDFRREHKNLLTAQVLLTDAQAKLTEAQRETEAKMKELAEAQAKTKNELHELSKRTDERIAAMTSAIGELVRRWPLPPSPAA